MKLNRNINEQFWKKKKLYIKKRSQKQQDRLIELKRISSSKNFTYDNLMDLSIKICDGILEREREREMTCERLEEGKKEGRKEGEPRYFVFWVTWMKFFSLRYLTADFFGRSNKFDFFIFFIFFFIYLFFFLCGGVKSGRRRFVKFVEWENC